MELKVVARKLAYCGSPVAVKNIKEKKQWQWGTEEDKRMTNVLQQQGSKRGCKQDWRRWWRLLWLLAIM
jgi:hypothetical protein